MEVKIIKGELPWCGRTEWLYPSADKHTLDRPFRIGPRDVDTAVEIYRENSNSYRTCIQAGGALGVWAIRFSQLFERVITFEPEPTNWQCLNENTHGIDNIEKHNHALGCERGRMIHMGLTPQMIGHCGAWHVQEGGDVSTMLIDDLNLGDVDLIYLDIEGSEYDAFQGAADTITRCRPLIGLENMGWHSKYNGGANPVDLLEKEFGYTIIGKPYKYDLMLAPNERINP